MNRGAKTYVAIAFAAMTLAGPGDLRAAEVRVVRVNNADELRAAGRAATAGTRIEVAPGEYTGGFFFENLRGEKNRPIVIAAADAAKPPRIVGGGSGLQLVNPFSVELHELHFQGASGNGLNIDHGGRYVPERREVVLKRIHVSDVGPRGNCDGIKLSGLVGFRVEDCTVERWGSGSGSGIDMVGCHDGVISGSRFRHTPDARTTGGSGIQAKGGSSGIVIRQNRFEDAGHRAVNLGGSTGLNLFAPPLERWPADKPKSEARNITVEGNTFIGGIAPLSFVGVDGAVVRCNTIYRPQKWAIRILQETVQPEFVPCRNGRITDNLFVFHSAQWAEGGLNVGGHTAPETFRFERNHWFCLDRPERSRPTLPTAEKDGTYGVDPQLRNAQELDLELKAGSPAKGKGAGGFQSR